MLLALSSPAYCAGFCTFTEQEKEFYEFTENYPFSDENFSPENVTKAQKRLDAYSSGEKVEYFIPKNTLNIIKGGKLQQLLREAKESFENYIPADSKKWDRKKHDLKYEYLKARKEYCDFQRRHYAIDW